MEDAVASALLQPWHAVASATDREGEMVFMRALAEHASESAMHALLAREDALIRALAEALWARSVVELRNTSPDAYARRDSANSKLGAQGAASFQQRTPGMEYSVRLPAARSPSVATAPLPLCDSGGERAAPSGIASASLSGNHVEQGAREYSVNVPLI
jgi:hypothetical protein